MELTNRKKRILRAIVEIYIATAEPVGSKAVAQQAGLDISSATIPITLDEMVKAGALHPGDKVAMVGFGAGLTYGAAVLEW